MGSTSESMDELLAPKKQRNMKRRLMESQVGAEVRRIHVIYFLSRKGHIEHPHLIRVHHLSRNGVHLRDIKRWLAELRGKEMPECFAWSYKRRYKNGYVWQDLLDEDLITPISDNEYVLKGSEISSTDTKDDSLSEKQSPTKEEISPNEEEEEEAAKHIPISSPPEGNHQLMDEPKKLSLGIDTESPSFGSDKSTLTDDSMKLEEDQFKEEDRAKTEDHSFCSSTSNSKKNKKGNNVNIEEKNNTPSSDSSTTSAQSAAFSRSKSYSNGASLLFRNLITCGAVETNDSAMVTISKRNKPSPDLSFTKQNHPISTELTKGDKFGGSQRVFGTTLNKQPQYPARRSFDGVRSSTKSKSEFNNQKAIPPYKPINGPQCSHCKKPFKPEKLHAHMKSCSGMKAVAKGTRPAISATSADKPSDRSSEFPFDNNPLSGYYLMHRQ